MKARDLFTSPIVNLTSYQSVDISRYPHANDTTDPHKWTFAAVDGDWISHKEGPFRKAALGAIRSYCTLYQTKFARLILTSMEDVDE